MKAGLGESRGAEGGGVAPILGDGVVVGVQFASRQQRQPRAGAATRTVFQLRYRQDNLIPGVPGASSQLLFLRETIQQRLRSPVFKYLLQVWEGVANTANVSTVRRHIPCGRRRPCLHADVRCKVGANVRGREGGAPTHRVFPDPVRCGG